MAGLPTSRVERLAAMRPGRAVIETRQLRYFVVVADELHFGRAAERLHMAQSPLSHQIRNLERELGVQLIDRAHHVVGLTAAGAVFYEGARQVLETLERMREDARRAARGETGILRVGYVGDATVDLVRRALDEFRARCPDVTVRVVEDAPARLADQLEDGRLDVAVTWAAPPRRAVEFERLVAEPLVAAVPVGRRPPGEEIPLEWLAPEPFVLPSRVSAPGLRSDIEAAFTARAFEPTPGPEANSLGAALLLVATGAGVALVPSGLARAGPRAGVAFVDLVPAPLTSAGVAWRRGSSSALVRTFLEVFRAGLADVAATTGGPGLGTEVDDDAHG